MQPIILTLALDAAARATLNALRAAHFPPERNYLDAHLTLFHALPGAEIAAITGALAEAAARQPAFPVRIAAPYSLGGGVALLAESPALHALRKHLAEAFAPHLTPQDAQGFRPHVTIQNKVAPATAKALLAQLHGAFTPLEAVAEGLDLWHYEGGPWRHAHRFAFAPGAA